MYSKEQVREELPEVSKEKFDDIVLSRVLGANAHSKIIGEIMIDIANHPKYTGIEILEKIEKVGTFFKETRGQNSRAIYNAINTYTRGFKDLKGKEEKRIREFVIDQILSFEKNAKEDLNNIVSFSTNLCEQMDSIMIFDYSSTVDAFVKRLPNKMHIYIPESRALDGGRPFVKNAVNAGHHVHFIPDTTMLSALKKCQAAFMGAETIYPDGTVFNTIGSDILAILCEYLKKPLYVLTPLIKVDIRPLHGYVRLSPMPFDYGNRLASAWEQGLKEKVDFKGFKLLEIPSNQISGYITEKGILSQSSLYLEIKEYMKEMEETI